MSPNEARVLVHLETHGPQTMIDLLALPRMRLVNLNEILARLLAAGQIERCVIGQGGGVRVKRSEVQTQAGVAENAF